MTAAKTTAATTRSATGTGQTYTQLLRRARQLFASDVETRFEMAVLFGKMLKLKTAVEVAEDTDMTPGGVERIARVAEFWGNVRIKPDGAGKRNAPWFMYDQIALDPVMSDEQKRTIKAAAPVKGLSFVRQMIRDARHVSPARADEVVNGPAQPRSAKQQPTRRSGAANVTVNNEDGIHYAIRAAKSLQDANDQLDRLESLSENDTVIINGLVNKIVRNVVRLSK